MTVAPHRALGRALVRRRPSGSPSRWSRASPALVVLAAPFVMLGGARAACTARARRRCSPPGSTTASLHEGQGTTSRLDAQRRRRRRARHPGRPRRPPYVALRPGRRSASAGCSTADGAGPSRSARGAGARRMLGEEKVALTRRGRATGSARCRSPGDQVRVLPTTAPYDSRAEAPQPLGLVGAHRSQRAGTGTELAEHPPVPARATGCAGSTGGSRCAPATCTWSAPAPRRTPACCSSSTRSPTTASPTASTAPPAASTSRSGPPPAIAEHHVRRGDRVALRVVGRGAEQVGYGAGRAAPAPDARDRLADRADRRASRRRRQPRSSA